MTYEAFLASKTRVTHPAGFDVDGPLHPMLFDFQEAMTRWALKRGRCAIFARYGLGKTPMQLVWADHVARHEGKPVLIFAPLAVSKQTAREGIKFDIPVMICESSDDIRPGVNITNYEKMHKFTPGGLAGVVLDESSILKAFSGKYRRQLTEFGRGIPYRLCATATPAPNDIIEISNHSEFLGIMTGKEVIALFFVQDGNTTHA